MNDTRARFEEIWPVPDDVYWCSSFGGYWHATRDEEPCRRCDEHDLRLDTFTRCQETTDVYVSLINEFIDCINNDWNEYSAADLANRAIHALGAK